MTSGSGAPLVVACSGLASIFKKPRTSPSSSSSLIGCTHRSKRESCGATIETVMASSELSMIGLMLAGVVDLQRRARDAEARAVSVHVGGRRRGLAHDREPDALALQARRVQRCDPVGRRI